MLAIQNYNWFTIGIVKFIVQELCKSPGDRPNEPSGFRGRKELLNRASALVTTCPSCQLT